MSDARPITNVTEYVCGACWNGFGALNPGVRGSDGSLTCPHCGHLQVDGGDWTSMVQDATNAADALDQPEVDFADTLPRTTHTEESAPVGSSAPSAIAREHAASPSIGTDASPTSTTPVVATAEATAAVTPPAAPDANIAESMSAHAAIAAALDAEPTVGVVAGAAELPFDLEEDTPVATVSPIPLVQSPNLNTAEELLAFLEAAEADGADDAFYGETMASLPAVNAVRGAHAPASHVEAAAAHEPTHGPRDDTGRDASPTELGAAGTASPGASVAATVVVIRTTGAAGKASRQAAEAKVTVAGLAPDLASAMDDDDHETAILAENTSPDLQIADLSPEPSEWKLRAPPGLTYNFHSVDALLGWASNRSTEGMQVSVDGQTWRPVSPFLDALRAGHRGRKAFALAQVPEMVASLRDGSRTALDDIRDVDVRDEVLRALESCAPGPPSAPELELVTRPSASRRSRSGGPVEPDEVPQLEAQMAEPEPPEEQRAGRRPTLRSMPQVVGGVTMQPADDPGSAGRNASAQSTGHPSGERRSQSPAPRTTSEQRSGGPAPVGKSQPSSSGVPAATSMSRPSSTRALAATKRDSGMSTPAKVGIALVVVVVAVVALHVLGIVRLPLP